MLSPPSGRVWPATHSECAPSWPLIVNLKPELNPTRGAQQMNKHRLTSWCAVASLTACGRKANRQEAETSADELVSAQTSCRLLVAVHSRHCDYQQILLCSRTQQMKALAIWWTSVWSRKAVEEREKLTYQLSRQQFMDFYFFLPFGFCSNWFLLSYCLLSVFSLLTLLKAAWRTVLER